VARNSEISENIEEEEEVSADNQQPGKYHEHCETNGKKKARLKSMKHHQRLYQQSIGSGAGARKRDIGENRKRIGLAHVLFNNVASTMAKKQRVLLAAQNSDRGGHRSCIGVRVAGDACARLPLPT